MAKSAPRSVILLYLACSLCCVTGYSDVSPQKELVYEWVSLDYDWPNDTIKQEYTSSGKFIKENNVVAGIKVYKQDVYVTVPRWREGVPSTLNKVITKDGKPILEPFPDWKSQTIGDCKSLQYVQSMEVDPNLGLMWIIDIGRINTLSFTAGATRNLCPAKLLVYDLNNKRYIKRYEFPATVAPPTTNFLNDIVIDYVDASPRYAYITDTSGSNPGLVVYDSHKNTSHRFTYLPVMEAKREAENITVNNITYKRAVNIDGIALSPDSLFLYFCPLSAYNLYQVSTEVVRNSLADFGAAVNEVGKKVSQTDGMAYGQTNLYFGVLGLNGVYKWEVAKDAKTQSFDKITLKTQTPVITDNTGMQWVDTFAFDENGYLWFTSAKLQMYFQGTLDFSQTAAPNIRIWKVFVGEKGYLYHNNSGSNLVLTQSVLFVLVFSYMIQCALKRIMHGDITFTRQMI